MKNKKILVIAAHPDDEILGCAATIHKLVTEGAQAYTLILSNGKDARSQSFEDDLSKEKDLLRKESIQANKIIGVKEVFFGDFPDNRFDTVGLLDITKFVEQIKTKIMPDIIFTHFRNDLNIDHKITYEAVITATRPLLDETVKHIYSFEVLSATQWAYPLTFSPNIFFDVTKSIDEKLRAMNEYQSELHCYPHPRSLEGIKNSAALWAMNVGIEGYCEAFSIVRGVY